MMFMAFHAKRSHRPVLIGLFAILLGIGGLVALVG